MRMNPLTQSFEALLEAFRQGCAGARHAERRILESELAPQTAAWNDEFSGFPVMEFPYASLRGLSRRGRRDAHLREIIVGWLGNGVRVAKAPLILNPACVFGRHSRDLAARLPGHRVVATDINPAFNWIQQRILRSPTPVNHEFRRENIFEPQVREVPAAVVFFGACGSLSDAAMDLAIHSGVPLLTCRTCCHENIGGNTRSVFRWTPMNWSFQLKNLGFALIRVLRTGGYFSDKFSARQYPRSQVAKDLSSPDEFLRIARHSVDSDLCRTLIDLDRCLRLVEHGYGVLYQGECFVARRPVAAKAVDQNPR